MPALHGGFTTSHITQHRAAVAAIRSSERLREAMKAGPPAQHSTAGTACLARRAPALSDKQTHWWTPTLFSRSVGFAGVPSAPRPSLWTVTSASWAALQGRAVQRKAQLWCPEAGPKRRLPPLPWPSQALDGSTGPHRSLGINGQRQTATRGHTLTGNCPRHGWG